MLRRVGVLLGRGARGLKSQSVGRAHRRGEPTIGGVAMGYWDDLCEAWARILGLGVQFGTPYEDYLCERLRAIGVDARLGRAHPWEAYSISIRGGPIAWARNRTLKSSETIHCWIHYGIPDARLSELSARLRKLDIRFAEVRAYRCLVERWESDGMERIAARDWSVDSTRTCRLKLAWSLRKSALRIDKRKASWTLTVDGGW